VIVDAGPAGAAGSAVAQAEMAAMKMAARACFINASERPAKARHYVLSWKAAMLAWLLAGRLCR
jgi:hypothetical protein